MSVLKFAPCFADVNSGVCTRDLLKQHDPQLATVLMRVYGDGSWRYQQTAPVAWPAPELPRLPQRRVLCEMCFLSTMQEVVQRGSHAVHVLELIVNVSWCLQEAAFTALPARHGAPACLCAMCAQQLPRQACWV